MGIKTGQGWKLPIIAFLDVYIIFIITSLPGLAISPIEGKLATIFPGTSHLEIQMITTVPNFACIPFVFLGGALGTKFNILKLVNWASIFYAIAGALCLFATEMWQLILLSLVCGLCAGVLSPLSVVIISKIFMGSYRTKQFGYTSATLNAVLVVSVIATGYLAEINWHLPFLLYVVPVIPIILYPWLKKYVPEPEKDKKLSGAPKVKFKFANECKVPTLIRICVEYFWLNFALASFSLYIPFLVQSYGHDSGMAGDLTSVIYAGIMISGFTLSWCLKILKRTTWDMILLFTSIGMLLMIVSRNPFIMGAGIFIASIGYGIGQPHAYDSVSKISTPRANSLALSFLMIMCSIGMVICPFIIDPIGKLLHLSHFPTYPYWFCLIISVIGWLGVLFRRLILQGKEKREEATLAHAGTGTAAPSNPSVKSSTPASAPSKGPASPTSGTSSSATGNSAETPTDPNSK